MVAEAIAPRSVKREKRPNLRIPLFTKIKARNLYVSQCLGAPEVSKATGLSPKQIYDLADREGWTKLRRELTRKVTEDSNARALRECDELVEEVANDTAELSLGTLAKAKETLLRDDEFAAKDLQAYSQAAKNFVGLYRQAKSLDAATEKTVTNVLFMGSLVRAGDAPAKPEPIDVTPAKTEGA